MPGQDARLASHSAGVVAAAAQGSARWLFVEVYASYRKQIDRFVVRGRHIDLPERTDGGRAVPMRFQHSSVECCWRRCESPRRRGLRKAGLAHRPTAGVGGIPTHLWSHTMNIAARTSHSFARSSHEHAWWLRQANRGVSDQVMAIAEKIAPGNPDSLAARVLAVSRLRGSDDGPSVLRTAQMLAFAHELQTPSPNLSEVRRLFTTLDSAPAVNSSSAAAEPDTDPSPAWARVLELPRVEDMRPDHLYRADADAMARIYDYGTRTPGVTFYLKADKAFASYRIPFDANGNASVQWFEGGQWTGRTVNKEQLIDFATDPYYDGNVVISRQPVSPAWSPQVLKIDPTTLPRGKPQSFISSSQALSRVMEEAWRDPGSVDSWSRPKAVGPEGTPFDELAPGQPRIRPWNDDLRLLELGVVSELSRRFGFFSNNAAPYEPWLQLYNRNHPEAGNKPIEFEIYVSTQPDASAAVVSELFRDTRSIKGLLGINVANRHEIAGRPANLRITVSSADALRSTISALEGIQRRLPPADFLQSSRSFAQQQVLPGVSYAQWLDLDSAEIGQRTIPGGDPLRALNVQTPTAMRVDLMLRALRETKEAGGDYADARARLRDLFKYFNIDPDHPHLNLYARSYRASSWNTP
jgi:hypothetical protein